MSRIFFVAAIILFFFAAVGVNLIPRPEAWGLVALACGLAVAGVPMMPWKKAQ